MDVLSYWTFTDIFEESWLAGPPFQDTCACAVFPLEALLTGTILVLVGASFVASCVAVVAGGGPILHQQRLWHDLVNLVGGVR